MKQFKVGKSKTNDIVINDPTVSREHLEIFVDDEKNVFITDLKSTNGTYVNSNRIYEPVKLKTLDVLKIGNTLIDWTKFTKNDDSLNDVYETLDDAKINVELKNSKFKSPKFKPIFFYVSIAIIFLIVIVSLLGSKKNNNFIKNEEILKKSVTNLKSDHSENPRKQRTNITYDFSCLSSKGDMQSNEVIYSFGEITRSVQSDFFDDIEISVIDEQKAGKELLNHYKKNYRFINSGKERENLNSILNNLVKRLAKPRGFNYKIFLIDDKTVNALTLGGHIFFFKGMYDFCVSNSELAAIISHEIAHNELGHSTLAMKKQKAADEWGVFGQIFLELENLTTKSFNQKQESEADLFGIDLVHPAKFNECESIELWTRMGKNENFNVIENFFRGHPYSKNRSKCIKNHLETNYNKSCL